MALQPYQPDVGAYSLPAHPPGFRYARQIHDLRPGEGVVMLRRRQPYVLAGRVAWSLLLLVMWAVTLGFLPGVLEGLTPDPLGGRLGPPVWVRVLMAVAW